MLKERSIIILQSSMSFVLNIFQRDTNQAIALRHCVIPTSFSFHCCAVSNHLYATSSYFIMSTIVLSNILTGMPNDNDYACGHVVRTEDAHVLCEGKKE